MQQLRRDVNSLTQRMQEVDKTASGTARQLQEHMTACRRHFADREEYAELPSALQRLEQRCADLSKRMMREAHGRLAAGDRSAAAQAEGLDHLRGRVADLEQALRTHKAEIASEWEDRRKKLQSHLMQTAKGVAHAAIGDEVEPLLRKERERIQGLLGDVEEIAKTSRSKLTSWITEQLEAERDAREELRDSLMAQVREEHKNLPGQSGGADEVREAWRRQVATQLDELRDIIKVGLRDERTTMESRCRKLSEGVRMQVEEVVEQLMGTSVKDLVAAAIQEELDTVRTLVWKLEQRTQAAHAKLHEQSFDNDKPPYNIQATTIVAETPLVPEVLECSSGDHAFKQIKATFAEFVDEEGSFALRTTENNVEAENGHVSLQDDDCHPQGCIH